MARQPTQQDRIAALLEKFEPGIRDAFLSSVRDIVDNVKLNAIVAALEKGDIEGAIRATQVDPAAFLPLDTAVRQAFVETGVTTAASIPASRLTDTAVVVRFDVHNFAAETWLSTHSSEFITEIVADQRTAIRSALTGGMERGLNPRVTALDIVGRQNPATGRREGGIIGLTSQQAGYVTNARLELQSGQAALMRNYLTRERRDKRFDGIVLKAIEEGKPLDRDTVTRLASRYSDRLLAFRGENIGRTESMAAVNGAQFEAYRQAVEKGSLQARAVRKGWMATRDLRTRDSHRALNGDFVGLEERFANGLLYPGDPSGDISERANCRCRPIFRIDRLSNLE